MEVTRRALADILNLASRQIVYANIPGGPTERVLYMLVTGVVRWSLDLGRNAIFVPFDILSELSQELSALDSRYGAWSSAASARSATYRLKAIIDGWPSIELRYEGGSYAVQFELTIVHNGLLFRGSVSSEGEDVRPDTIMPARATSASEMLGFDPVLRATSSFIAHKIATTHTFESMLFRKPLTAIQYEPYELRTYPIGTIKWSGVIDWGDDTVDEIAWDSNAYHSYSRLGIFIASVTILQPLVLRGGVRTAEVIVTPYSMLNEVYEENRRIKGTFDVAAFHERRKEKTPKRRRSSS